MMEGKNGHRSQKNWGFSSNTLKYEDLKLEYDFSSPTLRDCSTLINSIVYG